MHKPAPPEQPAILKYLSGDYIVVQPGHFVLCAVSGERIALDALKYWCADLQEAYRDAVLASRRFYEARKGGAA